MNLPRIIGITGKAGTGKDTLASHLVQQHNFIRYGFANPIKRILEARFGWLPEQWDDREWKERRDSWWGMQAPQDPRLPSEGYFSPRSWAQWLGTEVGRFIDPDCWVNLMEREWISMKDENGYFVTDRRMVVPDLRFNNEALRIRKLGGVVIEVLRHSATPITAHSSENGIDRNLIDFVVWNDSDIPTFIGIAMQLLSSADKLDRTA